MTERELRKGDQVEVHYRGTVKHGPYNEDWVNVYSEHDDVRRVPKSACTLIRKPLAVGDVIQAGDPEPPVGAAIQGRNDGPIFQLWTNGNWYSIGSAAVYAWNENLWSYGPFAVLFVPEAQQ